VATAMDLIALSGYWLSGVWGRRTRPYISIVQSLAVFNKGRRDRGKEIDIDVSPKSGPSRID
jgi:hypothetical protein